MTQKFGSPEDIKEDKDVSQVNEDASKNIGTFREAAVSSKSENLLAQSPRVEELIKELRGRIEQGELEKIRKDNFDREKTVPDWKKIDSFLQEQGFRQKKGKYIADDGTSVEEEAISFWVGLNQWDKARLEQASEYKNSLEFFRNLLATEEGLDVAGMPKTKLIEEIFRMIGTEKQRRGADIVYVFPDGEMNWKEMAEFLHFKNQAAMVTRFNERKKKEYQEEDRWKKEAEDWWKKYD